MEKKYSIVGIERAVETTLWNELFNGCGYISRGYEEFAGYSCELNSLYDLEDEWNNLGTGKSLDDMISEKLNSIMDECGKISYKGNVLHGYVLLDKRNFIDQGIITFNMETLKAYATDFVESLKEAGEDMKYIIQYIKASLSDDEAGEIYNTKSE